MHIAPFYVNTIYIASLSVTTIHIAPFYVTTMYIASFYVATIHIALHAGACAVLPGVATTANGYIIIIL